MIQAQYKDCFFKYDHIKKNTRGRNSMLAAIDNANQGVTGIYLFCNLFLYRIY